MRIKLIGTEKEKLHGFGVIIHNFQTGSCKKDHFTLAIPEYDEKRVRKFLKKKKVKYVEEK